MARPGSRPASSPPTTAAQLLERLLDLIASAASMADLDRDATCRALALGPADDDRRLQHTARLTDDWHCSVLADPDFALGPVLQVEFFDSGGRAEADMTDICALDLDQFSSRLAEAGFAAADEYGEHGEVISHEFTRGPLVVRVVARGEAGRPPSKVTHACVQSVTIQ